MTCLTVFVAGWITGFVVPAPLLWAMLAGLQPGSRWEVAAIYGGLAVAPVHAVFVKFLLPHIAHGRVAYLPALVACVVGGLISTAFFAATAASATATGRLGPTLFPLALGTGMVFGLVLTVGATGMLVWGSATSSDGRAPTPRLEDRWG